MKKIFLLSLGLVLGLGAMAQNRIMKNDLKEATIDVRKIVVGNEPQTSASTYTPVTHTSVVANRYEELDVFETISTYYDLQSNGWCSNRMYQLPNGSVGVVATMGPEDNPSGNDRGTGYNFYDASIQDFGEAPEHRIEPEKTGWPTIAQFGSNGEVLVSHAPTKCYIRTTAGEGEWNYVSTLSIPEGHPYEADYIGWPRVATSGDNHDIIHLIGDIQHQVSSSEVHHWQVYCRSLDGGQTWETNYSPLAQDNEEYDHYTADNYVIAANGHTVAMIYSDDLQSHMVMYKSTDDGQNWERTVIWENPYYGCDWETDECSIYTDTLYGPCNTSMVIDNHGVVHVAMNTWEFWHTELGTNVSYFYGRGVDGIRYWNDTQEAPIQSIDGNPHHALRLWWPDPENPGYMHIQNDSTKWIGFVPMYYGPDGQLISWNNDKEWLESDYFYKIRGGASGWPALAVDPNGNLACAFSSPCTARESEATTSKDQYYMRSMIISYYNAAEGYWYQDVDDFMDGDAVYMYSEAIFMIAAPNSVNVGEFWLGAQIDDKIGCYVGNSAGQTEITENFITVLKVIADNEVLDVEETEAKDVVYNIYPNPATDYIVVSSAMDANATITFVNLAGQTVKSINKALTLGDNSISIDLESGVYFCTVEANGFSKTTKVIVK